MALFRTGAITSCALAGPSHGPAGRTGRLHRFAGKVVRGDPGSADMRTFLGMAHAMNFDVYKSMDALEQAIDIDQNHFFAQLKYAELWYRLRALIRAEGETLKAVELAGNGWELSLARKQLQTVRELMRLGTQKPEWDKPLKSPAMALLALVAILFVVAVIWK